MQDQLGRTNSDAKIVPVYVWPVLGLSCQNDLAAAIRFKAGLHQLFHPKHWTKCRTLMLGQFEQKMRKLLETLGCNLMKWKIDFGSNLLRIVGLEILVNHGARERNYKANLASLVIPKH